MHRQDLGRNLQTMSQILDNPAMVEQNYVVAFDRFLGCPFAADPALPDPPTATTLTAERIRRPVENEKNQF